MAENKPKKTFMVCQQCGTLFRVETAKADAGAKCVKCNGPLGPLSGDLPHDQIATVLLLKPDQLNPEANKITRKRQEPPPPAGTEPRS